MKRIVIAFVSASLALPSMAQPRQWFASEVDRQGHEWAVVDVSTCFMRFEPDYEAPLETQAMMGTVVETFESKRYWTHVCSPDGYHAWTTRGGLAKMGAEEVEAYVAAPKYICIAEYTHIYTAPDEDSERIGDFTMSDIIRQRAAVSGTFVGVLTASGREGWVRASDVQDYRSWAESRELNAASLIALARKMLGVPYMWGGNSVKHFDCSGLVGFAYRMHGVLLPRNASQQIFCGEEVPMDFSLMQPGDLVFFGSPATEDSPRHPTHVAMYIGDGRIIHSSQLVKVNSLIPGQPDYYGSKSMIAVRRIIGHVDDGTGAISMLKSPEYFKQ